MALEAAKRFGRALAFGALSREVVAAFGVAARSRDRDAVNRGVDLAVAAAVQAVAVGLARADRDRGQAAGAREFGVAGESLDAGDLADQLAGGQRPEPRL